MIRLLPLALLASCAQTLQVDSNMPEETCSADKAQALVGQPASQELAAEALKLSGARSVRWLRPGMAVTMDYRAGRLNITLDDANRVERLTCG